MAKKVLGFDDIRFDTTTNQVMLFKGDVPLGIGELSSGERVFFVLAVDIARRLMIAYPSRQLEECEAVVLIDEIELHLHPTWQREIVPKLLELFTKCQFIVTTHSPQVVGSISSEHIRLLSKKNGEVDVRNSGASKGRDSNYILETVLDSTERTRELDELIDNFDHFLRKNQFDRASDIIDKLQNSIEGSSATVSILTAKLQRKKR